jgi:enoyl-CoA hydratase/carnithine racemase
MPLARLGLIVPFDLTRKLVEILGTASTKQILFTAEPISGTRAYEIGMVHQVVPLSEVEQVSYEMAGSIARNAPLALAGIKTMILRTLAPQEGIEHADLDELVRQNRQSVDAREGIRAWLEKRQPFFRGE